MLKHICALAAFALAAGAAHAQSRPRPDDPRAPAPPPVRASAFEGYRPYRDEPPSSWREVNDEVGRVGGHTGVIRAERETAPPPKDPPAQPPQPKGRP